MRGFPVSIEEREGVLDQISEKGILLSGSRLSYSRWYEGDRPTEDSLGCKIRVVVDAGEKCTFLKKVLHVGEKSQGWMPPDPGKKGFFGGGGGRGLTPEELELKRAEGPRISRNCSIEHATEILEKKIPLKKLGLLSQWLASFTIDGVFPPMPKELLEGESEGAIPPPAPSGTPSEPAPPAAAPAKTVPASNPPAIPTPGPAKGAAPAPAVKPKKLSARVVGALFNDAMRGGLVEDWKDYLARIEDVLKVKVKNPYHLDAAQFATVEAVLRKKLGHESAA